MIRRLDSRLRLALAGLGVLALGALIAGDVILTGEVGAAEALNGLPDLVVDGLGLVMQLGTHPAIVLIALVAAVLVDRRRLRVVAAVLLAGGLASIGSTLVKEVVERPRPVAVGADVVVRDDGGGFAYPSSHVGISTGALTAAALATRRNPSAALGVGAVVGVGRMAAGVHLPLDVVGGVALGALCAATAVALVDR